MELPLQITDIPLELIEYILNFLNDKNKIAFMKTFWFHYKDNIKLILTDWYEKDMFPMIPDI